jgi:uncharacterized membrane protein
MRVISTLDLVAFVTALGAGLIAGAFFAFSTFVMKALGSLPPAQGIAAMQSINVVVINPWFLTPFIGTAASSAVIVIAAMLRWNDPRAVYWLTGGLLYIVGTFLVTMLFNVPRNDGLAVAVPTDPAAARLWLSYLSTWTAWNHVRTLAALAAAAVLTIGLYLRS